MRRGMNRGALCLQCTALRAPPKCGLQALKRLEDPRSAMLRILQLRRFSGQGTQVTGKLAHSTWRMVQNGLSGCATVDSHCSGFAGAQPAGSLTSQLVDACSTAGHGLGIHLSMSACSQWYRVKGPGTQVTAIADVQVANPALMSARARHASTLAALAILTDAPTTS